MRARVIGSLVVTLVGIIPTIIGGPVFALLLIVLGVAGFREYLALASRIGPIDLDPAALTMGYTTIVAFGLAALLGAAGISAFAITMMAVAVPLVVLARHSTAAGSFQCWSMVSVGSLYLGLPVYAAIALRALPNSIDAIWLTNLASRTGVGWDVAPRGLAWALTVILATWVGDTSAFFSGRSFGKRKLAPKLSPNKTLEGSLGGLAGAVIVGVISSVTFGLGAWWQGALSGGVIGIAGQAGDLSESFLKRQAGVKDSGTSIPGHGGVLDRIDSLLFAFPVGLVLAISSPWLSR